MRSRNYTQEIGVSSSNRSVPAPVAFVIMAVLAVAAFMFIRHVLAAQPAHHDTAGASAPVQAGSH